MNAQPSLTFADWLTLLLLSLLWGGSFFLGKIAIQEISPFALVLFRVCIAALCLNLFAAATRLLPPVYLWRQFLFLGLLNNVIPFCLIFWGQTEIASGLASIINATTPLFSALFAVLFHEGEKLDFRRLSGIAAGLLGVAILIGPTALDHLDAHIIAELAIVGAAISYALAALYARRFRSLPPLIPAIGQVNAASLIMIPIWLYAERPWQTPFWPSNSLLLTLGILGIASTAVAYILYFRLIARAGATNATLVTFLVPVSAILLGYLFLGERLDISQITGMALVFTGLSFIDGRLWFKVREIITR